MDYAGFLHRQIATIVRHYFNHSGNSAWIGGPASKWPTRGPGEPGARIDPLAGFGPTEAVVRCDADNCVELWCKPVDKTALRKAGKRDLTYSKAWAAFTSVYAKTTPSSTVNGVDLEIDHLYPETAGTRSGLTFVRLLPVDERPNVRVGSAIERLAAGPKPGTAGRPRHATAFTMANVSGFLRYFRREFSSSALARALVDHMLAQGYPMPSGALADVEADIIANQIDWYRGDL